ncbi:CoA transferase [Pollutimonas subterranea]|uniref:CoA transferase n=1 Tax=Pollutimonas subterranea TaxID=2045210 RepID=A0A2N4U6L6_9BURK|nr:CaiB/BaiF CoA-transferase family protein [Pollutimonas subterranea]PLC50643.1 CoA transferase [Pollutimonas subterranea]
MIEQALNGVRVVDLSRILAGPWCTQNLADLGAEVVKIERPGTGDDTRRWGPPFMMSNDGSERTSAYFMCCNRNKKSVCLDFKAESDRQKLLQLLRTADVVVENYRVGTLKQYGLDYESVRALNPEVVYLSITGYGQDGPKADRPGYDYIFQGLGGLMSYTGRADGEPGAGPLRAGVAVVDVTTGMYATSAVLAALYQRSKTGRGTYLDIALLDVAVAMNANQASNFLVSGSSPERSGNAHPNLAPYEVFQASDGYFILAVGNDEQFTRLCQMIDQPHWAHDPKFSSNADRLANLIDLRGILASVFLDAPREYWGRQLQARGISWGTVNSLDEVFSDEQVVHREMLRTTHHPEYGDMPIVRNPMLSDPQSRRAPVKPVPQLGEHTEEVLASLPAA